MLALFSCSLTHELVVHLSRSSIMSSPCCPSHNTSLQWQVVLRNIGQHTNFSEVVPGGCGVWFLEVLSGLFPIGDDCIFYRIHWFVKLYSEEILLWILENHMDIYIWWYLWVKVVDAAIILSSFVCVWHNTPHFNLTGLPIMNILIPSEYLRKSLSNAGAVAILRFKPTPINPQNQIC